MQLTEISDQFTDLGLSIVTLTYDSVEMLKEVQEDYELDYTLLHDEDVTIVDALGVRNIDYEPGHRFYGIPYPGIFIVNSDGVITAKFAEESYRDRPDLADVIAAAAAL